MDPFRNVLDEYKAQRLYRHQKRNEYLRKFEQLQGAIRHSAQPVASQIVHPKVDHTHTKQSAGVPAPQEHAHNAQLAKLEQENSQLKRQLIELDRNEQMQLQAFQKEVGEVKQRYIQEVESMGKRTKQMKDQVISKMQKMTAQNDVALKKNQEIQMVNEGLKNEVSTCEKVMSDYLGTIKEDYESKISEFAKVYEGSNEKISQMERDFNEDEFIENTLKNEELLKGIEENAVRAKEAGSILKDYEVLYQGKKQILGEIRSNVEMKEKEVAKMAELEGKIKIIMQKMGEEKKIYVAENQRMTEELLEIKTLIMGAMNQQE